ncbi:MAG TPA: hypothetical protein VJ623_07200 [Holophagaceae bacterium]|nr:hypothetical protein [Holophagaceae bacterium]
MSAPLIGGPAKPFKSGIGARAHASRGCPWRTSGSPVILEAMTSPVEALSPLRPAGQTRAEERPATAPERLRAERARGAQANQAKVEGLGQHLDLLA